MSPWRSVVLLWAWTACASCNSDLPDVLVLVNEIDQVRIDEPVVIARSEVESRLGPIESGRVPLAVSYQGAAVPSQVDDLDGDGKWDAWAIMVSFAGLEVVRLQLNVLDSTEMPQFKTRTNVRVEPHGQGAASGAVAWENDVIGFRLALDGPARKQVLGKITMEMILDSIATAGMAEDMALWGRNLLDERTSLGAGALAAWVNGDLTRPGSRSGANVRLVSEGPVRSVFEIRYPDWVVDGTACDLTERITIWAGRPGFESTVTARGGGWDIVVGIARAREDTLYRWQWDTSFDVIAAHGRFSRGDDVTGLAILYDFEADADVGSDAGDSYVVRLPADDDSPVKYYVYAVWDQQNYHWANRADFEHFLRDEARRLASPVRLR